MKCLTLLVFILPLMVSCASKQKSTEAKVAAISYSYGTQYLMAKDYTQAITHLLKAAKLDPDNAEVHNNLGMAYYFKGQKDMAKQHIRKALELDDKNTDALTNLGSLLFEEGDLNGAEQVYFKCLKDLTYEKQARVYMNLALIEIRRGQLAKATAYLNNSVKEDESYCPAWFQLGQIEFRKKDFGSAMKHFRNAGMGTCVNDPAPFYWQALVYIEQREFLNARLKFDEINTRFSTSPYAVMAKEKLSYINLLEQRSSIESANLPTQETATPKF